MAGTLSTASLKDNKKLGRGPVPAKNKKTGDAVECVPTSDWQSAIQQARQPALGWGYFFSRGLPALSTRKVWPRPFSNGSTVAVISRTR